MLKFRMKQKSAVVFIQESFSSQADLNKAELAISYKKKAQRTPRLLSLKKTCGQRPPISFFFLTFGEFFTSKYNLNLSDMTVQQLLCFS